MSLRTLSLEAGKQVNVVRQITDLRQRLAESQKTVLELEAEREQRQRDYDKKLLLAKSKIENVQVRMGKQKRWRSFMFIGGVLKDFLLVQSVPVCA